MITGSEDIVNGLGNTINELSTEGLEATGGNNLTDPAIDVADDVADET